MKVVCAACHEHYADLADEMPFAEKLMWSDGLALAHGPKCTATREEHAAGVDILAAISALDGADSNH